MGAVAGAPAYSMRRRASWPSAGVRMVADCSMICIFRLLRFGSGRLCIEACKQRAVGQGAADDSPVILQHQALGGAAEAHVHITGAFGLLSRLCQTARAGRRGVQQGDDAVGADNAPEPCVDESLGGMVHKKVLLSVPAGLVRAVGFEPTRCEAGILEIPAYACSAMPSR